MKNIFIVLSQRSTGLYLATTREEKKKEKENKPYPATQSLKKIKHSRLTLEVLLVGFPAFSLENQQVGPGDLRFIIKNKDLILRCYI